jgi:hypothetical protein
MNNAQVIVNSFTITIDVPVQLKCKTSMFYNNMGNYSWVLFNFDNGMCSVGNTVSHDGGMSYHWNYHSTMAIRESKDGLQYHDQNHNGWKFFDDDVQQEYCGYKLEHEIK